MSDYDQIDAMNWSRLKLLRISPLHFHRPPPKPDVLHLRKGRAVHTLVLEPERFTAEYAIWLGARRGKAWIEFRDAHTDVCVLTEAEADVAKAAADAVLANADAMSLLTRGVAEQPLVWTDAETGVRCKGRTDYTGDGSGSGRLVDLKTTAFIELDAFGRQCAKFGYHGQMSYYHDGLVANGAPADVLPALVVVQSAAPHDVVVYDVPDYVIDAGRALYRRLLRLLVQCRERGEWPGVAQAERQTLHLPEWALTEYTDPDAPVVVEGVSF